MSSYSVGGSGFWESNDLKILDKDVLISKIISSNHDSYYVVLYYKAYDSNRWLPFMHEFVNGRANEWSISDAMDLLSKLKSYYITNEVYLWCNMNITGNDDINKLASSICSDKDSTSKAKVIDIEGERK